MDIADTETDRDGDKEALCALQLPVNVCNFATAVVLTVTLAIMVYCAALLVRATWVYNGTSVRCQPYTAAGKDTEDKVLPADMCIYTCMPIASYAKSARGDCVSMCACVERCGLVATIQLPSLH